MKPSNLVIGYLFKRFFREARVPRFNPPILPGGEIVEYYFCFCGYHNYIVVLYRSQSLILSARIASFSWMTFKAETMSLISRT